MSKTSLLFQRIGIMGKPESQDAAETIQILYQLLLEEGCDVYVQESVSDNLNENHIQTLRRENMGKHVDLVIVVGGDGSMLNAGRNLIEYQTPVVGINRGHLGFLTDVRPTEVKERISEILYGDYIEEKRFILNTVVSRNHQVIGQSTAVNDVVLYPGEIARMIEFELFIDEQFVYSQRSDGLIVSTPTGSTAYALSGGGPIMFPTLNSVVLVPMFPHTLSSRPIVINADSEIKIIVSEHNQQFPMVSCDAQVNIELAPEDNIVIKKYDIPLTLLHPKQHDYYKVLRTKLGWGQKL